MTSFGGYSEAEIAAVEGDLGVEFPRFFRSFLREMGKASGEVFCGSDFAGLERLGEFRREATELMLATDSARTLPGGAIVFLFHQGCAFDFFVGGSHRDAPVLQWCEGDGEPTEVCPSFEQLLEDRLQRMERGYERLIETGGYYLTLYPEGGKREHRALNSGDRPLDKHAGGSSIGSPQSARQRFASRVATLWRRR